jgi:hypothetical protein
MRARSGANGACTARTNAHQTGEGTAAPLDRVCRAHGPRGLKAWYSSRSPFEAAAIILTSPQLNPIGKIPEYKFCAARVEKAATPAQAAE